MSTKSDFATDRLRLLHQVSDTITETIPTEREREIFVLNNKILIVTKNTSVIRGEDESWKSCDMWVVAGVLRVYKSDLRGELEQAKILFPKSRLNF